MGVQLPTGGRKILLPGIGGRRLVAAALVVAVVSTGIWGYWVYAGRKGNAGTALAYETATVQKGNVEVRVAGTGTVALQDRVEVQAGVAGTVSQILAFKGQKVKSGEGLVQLSSDTTLNQAEQARLDVDIARANLNNLTNPSATDIEAARLRVSRLELQQKTQEATVEKYSIRSETAGAVRSFSMNKGDQVNSGALVAQIDIAGGNKPGAAATDRDLAIARARVDQAQIALDDKTASREDLVIKAPAGGRITAVLGSAGENVNANTRIFSLRPQDGSQRVPTATAQDVEIAQKRVDQAQEALQSKIIDRGKLLIYASISGRVEGLNIKQGDSINSGFKAASIQDPSRLTFRVKIGQDKVSAVEAGQRATVWIQDQASLGQVVKVATEGVLDGKLTVFPVDISMENNPNNDFRPGMTGYAYVNLGGYETFYAAGSITAIREEQAVARLAGQVAEVMVIDGDNVTAGQPLLRLDGSSLESQIRQAQIDLETAQNNLAKLGAVEVTAKVAGKLNSVAVQEGDGVTAGQVLAVIDGAVLENQIRQAQIDLDAAQNNMDKLYPPGEVRANAGGTVREVLAAEGQKVAENQVIALLDDTDFKLQLEQTKNDLAVARAALDQLRNPDTSSTQVETQRLKVQQAELTYRTRQADAAALTVTAPIDGTVIAVNVKQGEQLTKSSPVMVISDPGGLQVNVNVDELDIAKIRPSQEATVTLSALPGKEFPGQVTDIAAEGIAQSGVTTFPVTITLKNALGVLPGMSADVNILIDRKEGVLVVPAESVTSIGQRRVVSVVVNGEMPQPKPIEVGLTSTETVEVKSGLAEGDVVVVAAVSAQNASMRTVFTGMGGMPGGAATFRQGGNNNNPRPGGNSGTNRQGGAGGGNR